MMPDIYFLNSGNKRAPVSTKKFRGWIALTKPLTATLGSIRVDRRDVPRVSSS